MGDAIIPRIWMPPLWEVGDGIIPTDGQCELDDVSYILATPEALASSPEVAALVAEAEARGMERALETMKTAGDSAVTEAMGQRLCCNGQDCGCHGATVEQYLEHLIRAEASAIRRAAEETGT
jgi:hypothetical protein